MDEAPAEILARCDGMSLFPKQMQRLFGEAERSKVFKLGRKINRGDI